MLDHLLNHLVNTTGVNNKTVGSVLYGVARIKKRCDTFSISYMLHNVSYNTCTQCVQLSLTRLDQISDRGDRASITSIVCWKTTWKHACLLKHYFLQSQMQRYCCEYQEALSIALLHLVKLKQSLFEVLPVFAHEPLRNILITKTAYLARGW